MFIRFVAGCGVKFVTGRIWCSSHISAVECRNSVLFYLSCNFGTASKVPAEMLGIKGIVLGVYPNNDYSEIQLTDGTAAYDAKFNGALKSRISAPGMFSKYTKQRVFYDFTEHVVCVTAVDANMKDVTYNPIEDLNEKKEAIRIAVAGGVKQLINSGIYKIEVDTFDDPESAAEGSHLITYVYDELKSESSRRPKVTIMPFNLLRKTLWNRGVLKAEVQNFARYLTESPANYMTPTIFAEKVHAKLSSVGVEVTVRDKSWVAEHNMNAFLAVAQGSAQDLKLVELYYHGLPTSKPVVLVGKGITFDSGGISLKPSKDMDKMRGDMGGGACVAAAIYGIAEMKAPVSVRGIIPLCENLPDGNSIKPGDVVYAMNGKSIQIDNTDAEGRLILADALVYAQSYSPSVIVDLATLTGAMEVALGAAAAGVFTNAPDYFKILHEAAIETGDRVWKMPLFNLYNKHVTECRLADVNNIGTRRSAGACTAAAFLSEFVGDNQWMHLDIAGVFENTDEVPYLSKGMSGRPTRTLMEFLIRLSENNL